MGGGDDKLFFGTLAEQVQISTAHLKASTSHLGGGTDVNKGVRMREASAAGFNSPL